MSTIKIVYKVSLIQFLFYLIVIYYWLLSYFLPTKETLDRFSPLYFLTILPVYLYIAISVPKVVKRKWTKEGVVLVIFFIATSIISVLRLDFNSLIKISSVSLLFLIVIKTNIRLSTSFLNTLFILSILGGIISYYVGTNVFGFLPGMSKANLWQGLGWRVSLFNSIPNSGFFSLIIFIINIFDKRKLSFTRKIILLLAIYFLILSGSRTAILIFILIVSFKIITLFKPFERGKRFLSLSFFFILIALSVFYFNNFTLALYKLDNSFINSLVFKSKDKIKNEAELEKINYRTWLWDKHVDIYSENPIFGKGDYDIRDYLSAEKQYSTTNYSESYLTDLLVKVGILITLFLAFFYYLIKKSIHIHDSILYSMVITLIILMLSYGSFFVPYNFLFLTIIGTLSLNYKSISTYH